MERLLPDWLSGYMAYTKNSEPPDMYKVWVGISVISACLQRKSYLIYEGKLYPNMYVVLVGPSGKCRKGTAIRPGVGLLRGTGVKTSGDAVTRERLIQKLQQATDTYLTEDGSAIVHASMAIISPELTVFIGYQQQELITALTDWFDCADEWSYETKHQGKNDLKSLYVSLLGATTPELIQTTMARDAIGGGLTSRMVFVYEGDKSKAISRPFSDWESRKEIEDALAYDLTQIANVAGVFTVDDHFWNRWDKWYLEQQFESKGNPLFDDVRFAGYMSRRPTHLLKLSMIMNVSRGNDMILTVKDFDRALKLLERTEEKMRYTFSGVGQSTVAALLPRIASLIQSRGDKGINLRDILKTYYFDVGDQDTVLKLVATLEHIGTCRRIVEGNKHMIYYIEGTSL